MMREETPIRDFDDIFPHIGEFKAFQWIIFGSVCLLCCLFSFVYYGQIFMTLTPPHWCNASPGFREELERRYGINMTVEQVKVLTIPPSPTTLDYSKCARYDISTDMVALVNGTFEASRSWPTTECHHGWHYDYSLYYPTITSQLDWVCREDWKPAFSQACFFFGSLIGVPVFGALADHLGRMPIIVSSNLVAGVFGIASSFSTSFPLFCFLRFIVGFAHDSNFIIGYILGLEYMPASYRTIVANVPIMIFLTLSMCFLPWIAYYLANWTIYGVVIHSAFFSTIILPWVIPESARWLLSKGETERVVKIVENAAKLNGKVLSEEFKKNFKDYTQKFTNVSSTRVTCLDLLKLPNLRKRFILLFVMWISIYFTYDGHVRHTENIGANIFISFSLMGAVEFPGDLLTIFLMENLGRRHTTVWSLVLAGVTAFGISFIPKSKGTLLLGLAMTGRFLITISINVGTQYIVEILPTVGRAQGSGAIHTVGMGIAFLSPYIVYLSKFYYGLPYLIFGLISLGGGLLCLLLLETLGEKLPDSLVDGEEFFKDQTFCYNPCRKNIQEDETSESVGTELTVRPEVPR